MKSILIKDTTKEEREKIVADALGCGSDCSMCCGCGGMEIDYQQYIDGKKEIAQLNAEYRANTMIGPLDYSFPIKSLIVVFFNSSSKAFWALSKGLSRTAWILLPTGHLGFGFT